MRLLLVLVCLAPLMGQTPCASPETYRPCDLVFELTPQEMAAHPNPYLTLSLYAEVKSPRFKTFLLNAFQESGNRFLIRFAPTEPGEWSWRLTSGFDRFNGKTGAVTATDSGRPGFIQPANIHHWNYPDKLKGHLWMGDTMYRFAYMDRKLMETTVDRRAQQKFNHIRGLVFPFSDEPRKPFRAADQPDLEFFKELDDRMRYITGLNIVVDLILGADQNQLANLFPTWQERERYVRYMTSRYSAFDLTWQVVQEFEEYKNGRELVKEVGLALKKHDPYNHPRSTHTVATSASIASDGWITHILYQSSDHALGAIEHLLYTMPQVNVGFGYEDSGAGKSQPSDVDSDTFRTRLWNAAMSGQYPTYGNTGTYGGRKMPVSDKHLDSPGAKAMTVWQEFFAGTRFWELEPYFYVDGGRALALIRDFSSELEDDREAIEYVVYIEKPRLVEVEVVKHNYNVYWINPATGERVTGKEFKGTNFVSEPPNKLHDWVLHLSRDGKKAGMLRSYKFDSRPYLRQEIEPNSSKNPFTLLTPVGESLSLSQPAGFELKLNKPTRGTRTMFYVWTAEVNTDGQGYRVVGVGERGTLNIPANIATRLPAVLNLRVAGMNANGKIYVQDKVFRLVP